MVLRSGKIPILLLVCMLAIPACDPSASNGDSGTECQGELAELEASIRAHLDAYPADADFTLLLKTSGGRVFEHSVGESSAETSYRSASTSKWVTAAVILLLVDEGLIALDDHPQDHIDFWPESGWTSEILLSQLLSFTSGLVEDPICISLPNSDYEDCVETILDRNLELSQTPGSEFHYGSSHMQVAGLMAIEALGVDSWSEVFEHFQDATGLFPNSAYDLPSESNPRLAGGMHWIGSDYLEFLEAIQEESLLAPELLALMLSDRIADASIAYSPAWEGIGEDWHYGFGCWIECHSELFDCPEPTRISSPGAYGAYPFVDYEQGYFGILAREGVLGTYVEGYLLIDSVSPILDDWAAIPCD